MFQVLLIYYAETIIIYYSDTIHSASLVVDIVMGTIVDLSRQGGVYEEDLSLEPRTGDWGITYNSRLEPGTGITTVHTGH